MKKYPLLVPLGARISAIRKEKGYSQEGFAADAGLGRSYYGAIERGERNVSALNLILIAKTLKVEVGELFPPMKQLKKNAARKSGA